MIKKITIKDTASFDNVIGVSFVPTLINFIYGSNGSGKTTISNIIADCSAHPNCNIDWGLATPLQTLVYNRKFIESNFEQLSELKGIFTLGKESKEEIENIKNRTDEITEKEKIIVSAKTILEQETEKLKTLESNFSDKCWAIHKEYEEIFIKAFEGNRSSKERFKAKVISEFASNKQPLETYVELEQKANAILNTAAARASEVKEIITLDLKSLEQNSIFQTRIIGKDDVDIARMILKLNNSDWVRQGISYLKANDDYCPFCQQITTQQFREQLNEYFDETYNQQILALKSASNKYYLDIKILLETLSAYLTLDNQFIDVNSLTNLNSFISSVYQKNLLNLEKKAKEPTIKIELESISEPLNKAKLIIDLAIIKTKEHNKLIANIEIERKTLIAKIWAYVINDLKKDFEIYQKGKEANEKATKALIDKIKLTQNEIKALKINIQNSESKITSVKPTIDAINKTLAGFGFNNFSLTEGTTIGSYKVVRESGHDAKQTLSEGEKTFITFLYFFHLTSGSFETDKITHNKVLVIDDPISSLDSSILFIVSNLVRQLISQCRTGTSNIKQIYILTHNVYFHKEVTFQKRGDSNKGESFWIIKKIGNASVIEQHEENPIQTSYDLLWHEIRHPAKINKITVFNTLRRILEYYFKILGRMKDDELLQKFEGEDKIISNSLLSWINEGSHLINDDVFIATDDETVEKYLKVFKRIFEVENQIEHYNMMMKIIS